MTVTSNATTGTASHDTTGGLLEQGPDVLRAAALSASRQIPAGGTVEAGTAVAVADLGEPLAGPGAQALTVAVSGAASGGVTLIVAREVADALQDGPLGAADLSAALITPVTDAVTELEVMIGGALQVGVADIVEANAIAFGPGAAAVPLTDGDTLLAVLVVELSAADDVSDGVPAAPSSAAADEASFTPFLEDGAATQAQRSLELLHDVEMAVTVELGRTRMAVSDLLSLAPGAVVELDRAAGSPVDVLVNGKLIARGEVVVVDEDFGIRISEIVGLQQNRA